MDNLRCNRLSCRRAVAEKAVVTTCSHIFCVECANELFNASRLCPACDTSLTEPDDVVVCSLNPSNDYKTSVLSGLNPAIIVEICGRAMSFWQYQVHQEHTFQQAVIRNINEKNAQLQKELGNVIREANGELGLLNNKVTELQRDLELEKRKATTLQESLKEQEKEYQKLKAQMDKIKRRALLNPGVLAQHGDTGAGGTGDHPAGQAARGPRLGFGPNSGAGIDVSAVVNGMTASGVQRTPIVNRVFAQQSQAQPPGGWRPAPPAQPLHQPRNMPFNAADIDRSVAASTGSMDSLGEVENMLGSRPPDPVRRKPNGMNNWGTPATTNYRQTNRVFASSTIKRATSGFRPAGAMG